MTEHCVPCSSASFFSVHSVILVMLVFLAGTVKVLENKKDGIKAYIQDNAAEAFINMAMAPVEFLVSPLLGAYTTMLFVT